MGADLAIPLPAATAGAGLLGLVVGSFLNVVIHRLPRGESLVRPGSRCPACGRPIRPLENIPVLSYLALRGRCRGCGTRIPPRYPAVELACGLLFALVILRFGVGPAAGMHAVLGALLLAAAVIDLDHRIIPDELSLGGLLLGLGLVPAAAWLEGHPWLPALLRSGLGAVVGGGVLWTVGFLHARASAAAGRRFEHWPGEGQDLPRPGELDYWIWFPGLGFGDVKLMAMIGAFLGPAGVLETVVLASLLGVVFGLLTAAVRRSLAVPFGFGPAIAAGALLVALSPVRLLPFS